MWDDLGHDLVDGEIYNIGQSNYEEGCYALNLVGIYKQASHYTRHYVVVMPDRVPEHMQSLEVVSRDAFDALLSAFIENYISYDGGLTGSRKPFPISKKLQKPMRLLVMCGYVEKKTDCYCWTEKIGPIMRRWHIWDESGVNLEEQDERRFREAAERLAASVPPLIRRRLIKAMVSRDLVTAFEIVRSHLDGDKWHDLPVLVKPDAAANDAELIKIQTLKKFLQILMKERG